MIRKTYILGCGSNPEKRDDTVNVDYRAWENVNVVHNLEETPWPIADGAAKHANATHVVEHIKNIQGFMDECWRILSPGGSLFMEVPNVRDMNMAWADPTHVRAFTKHTFINYMTIEGVHQHGVFKHAWSILHIEETDKIIRVHMAPVPDEYLTDESIAMWANYKKQYSHD